MASNKPVIAVDLDDVLFDFIGYFFDWHNQVFQTNFKPQDFHQRRLWELWNGTKEQAGERIARFFEEIDMLAMPPIAGAQQTLQQIKDTHSLVVISARSAHTLQDTQDWLDKYFHGLFSKTYLGISDPLAKQNIHNKAELCQQVGAKTLIDDQLKNLEDCAALGIRFLLFGDYAWNQIINLPPNTTRVTDWNQALKALEC